MVRNNNQKSTRLTSHPPFKPKAGARLLAALMAVHGGAALAMDWKVTPNLSVSEMYSDNITLAPPGKEQSDFVTQITPGVTVTGNSRRLKVNANYSLQNLFYAQNSNRNTFYHRLNASANAELVDQLLFLDASAAVQQQAASLLGPIGIDNTTATGNIAESRNYSISPYLVHRFGTFANTQLRFTHAQTDYSVGNAFNYSSNQADFRINSGTSFKDIFWSGQYTDQKIDYQVRQDVDLRTASGTLGYVFSPKFNVSGTVGYDDNNYLVGNGPAPKGSFWSAGFAWAPSHLTNLSASYGHRYFGTTYGLDFTHRTRRTIWNVNYNQAITTTQSQFSVPYTLDTTSYLDTLYSGVIPDAAQRQLFVQTLINVYGLPGQLYNPLYLVTANVFLDKSLNASVGIDTGKSTFLLSAFNTSRESQETGTQSSALLGTGAFLSTATIKQYGVNGVWTWRLLPRTTSTLSTGWTHLKYPDIGRDDNLKYIRLGFTRVVNPKLSTGLEFRHQMRDSNQSTNDYKENAITARLFMTF